jgi:histidine triad (HIT) family protein
LSKENNHGSMNHCIFCNILNKELPAEILYEDEDVVAFPDIAQVAPVHILIIPKEHIASINELPNDTGENIAGKLIMVAKKLAKKHGIDKSGFKLLFRVGNDGGQEVPHIHLHLIGGAQLVEDIYPVK